MTVAFYNTVFLVMTSCSVMGGYKSFHRHGRSTNRGYSSDTLVTLTTVRGVKRQKTRTAKIFDVHTAVLMNFRNITEL